MSRHKRLPVLLLFFTSLIPPVAAEDYLSPTDIEAFHDGQRLLITACTARQLLVFDTTRNRVIQRIKLQRQPSGAVCSPDGRTFYVTAGQGPGVVWLIDAASGSTRKTIPVGHTPNSPVLGKSGKKLYVCNRFDNTVGIVDLQTYKQVQTIGVSREPIAADITPDGNLLFVANHLPDGRADLDYVASKMSVIDLKRNEVAKTIKLVNGAEGMRGVCVSPDGQYAFATHLMARYQVPTTQIERGWINTNALSVIRVSDQSLFYTLLLDDVAQGFANPWAVQVSPNNQQLYVTSAGNHEIRIIDLPALTAKIDRLQAAQTEPAEAVHLNAHNDLSFIYDVSQRIPLKGLGPRALLVKGTTLYVAEYFSDSLGEIVLGRKNTLTQVSSIPLGPKIPLTPERQGELFFNDASLCFQQWQSCASCHSNDGRTDALNWDLLNDGMGNPKNVKSLLLSHRTPPTMAMGVRDRAETAVRAGIRFIQFATRPEADAQALDAYIKSLKPVPSPKLINGRLSPAALQGQPLFQREGCASCHPAPLYTDLKEHNLGTGTGLDTGLPFDTPTLIEVWRTSPYLHDGRAVSLEDLIRIHNPIGGEGDDCQLTDEEISDLAAYVGSL
ncbi:cell surface protein [Planctomycetota bacterium]